MKNIYTTLMIVAAMALSLSSKAQDLRFLHETQPATPGPGQHTVIMKVTNDGATTETMSGYQVSYMYDGVGSAVSATQLTELIPGTGIGVFAIFSPNLNAPPGSNNSCGGNIYTQKVGIAVAQPVSVPGVDVDPGDTVDLVSILFNVDDNGSGCLQDFSENIANEYTKANETVGYPMIRVGEALAALPVDLVDFKARKFRSNDVRLNWSTASESNTSHFEIERSEDQVNWEYVGQVRAAGESSAMLSYDYTDEKVYDGRSARSDFFYRLRIVDFDGQFEYSNIDNVVFTGSGLDNGDITVYPNPSYKGLNVEFPVQANDLPSVMTLYDELGRVVFSKDISEETTYEYINYAENTITSGIYMLQISNSEKMISQKKVIVQR